MKTYLVITTENSAVAPNGFESFGIAIQAQTEQQAQAKLNRLAIDRPWLTEAELTEISHIQELIQAEPVLA